MGWACRQEWHDERARRLRSYFEMQEEAAFSHTPSAEVARGRPKTMIITTRNARLLTPISKRRHRKPAPLPDIIIARHAAFACSAAAGREPEKKILHFSSQRRCQQQRDMPDRQLSASCPLRRCYFFRRLYYFQPQRFSSTLSRERADLYCHYYAPFHRPADFHIANARPPNLPPISRHFLSFSWL